MSENCGENKEAKKCYDELEKFIKELPEKKGALITVLHKAQEIFGYLPREVQSFVSEKMDLPLAKIYGVITFYSFFTMKPKGKYPISVCTGTACYVRGAEKVLDRFKKLLDLETGETSEDGEFSVDSLRCVGACGLAPVVLVGEKVYGNVTPDQVEEIINNYK
ncbi:MAG: NAD(P)H-dependent oxidoreductase subunit E [Fusobacteriota bacterium]